VGGKEPQGVAVRQGESLRLVPQPPGPALSRNEVEVRTRARPTYVPLPPAPAQLPRGAVESEREALWGVVAVLLFPIIGIVQRLVAWRKGVPAANPTAGTSAAGGKYVPLE
jgi:hypothetical protein